VQNSLIDLVDDFDGVSRSGSLWRAGLSAALESNITTMVLESLDTVNTSAPHPSTRVRVREREREREIEREREREREGTER